MMRLLKMVISALSLLIGVFAILGGLVVIGQAVATKSWPIINGVIIRSNTEVVRSGKYGPEYRPHIAYRYIVGKTAYHGTSIGYQGPGSGSEQRANLITHEYPVGAMIPVHFNPLHPTEAVLKTGYDSFTWVPLLFGLGFFLIGIIGVRLSQKHLR